MTDDTDLIARLRALGGYAATKAADALEAQGRRLAEAEAQVLTIASLSNKHYLRLQEAEALLREANLQLRYRNIAAGLREMIGAFLGAADQESE